MDNSEIDKELGLSYDELCNYLLDKYGAAKYDYFVNDSCRTKNKKVTRTDEGLFCHHMDEDKAIRLSAPNYAKKNPYEYQKAERLVYCNALEHLILHIKIAEEPRKNDARDGDILGIGGVIAFMLPELNHCYSGFEYKRQYEKNLYGLIADSFDGYIKILKYWLAITHYTLSLTPELLSLDVDRKKVDRVYQALV